MSISRIGTGSSCSSTHQSGPKSSLQSGAKLIPDAILFHFCLLWNSVRKAWWQQKILPLLLISVSVINIHPLPSWTQAINWAYWYRKAAGNSLNFTVTMLICHCSVKRKPRHPHSVCQLVTAGQGTQVTSVLAVQSQAWQPVGPIQASPSQIPPQSTAGWGEIPQLLQEFISGRDLKWSQVCDGYHTLKCWNNYMVGGKWVFLPKIWFSCFSFGLFLDAKFSPLRSCSRIPFSAKSRQQVLFYPRKNETKPGDTWTSAETCWSCLWRQEGFGESWQLFLTIFPSKKQMKGNCQSWTGWVLLIQHFQRGQEVSRVCHWNVQHTGGKVDPALV